MEHLPEILTNTLNPNPEIRNQAENQLSQLKQENGFIISLLKLAGTPSTDETIKLSATIQLKNAVKKLWPTKFRLENNLQRQNNNQPLSTLLGDDEAALFKDNFFEALVKSLRNKQITKLLGDILSLVAKNDFPNKWKSLSVTLYNNLDNPNNLDNCLASLICLELLAKLQLAEIEEIVNKQLFKPLTKFAQRLTSLSSDSEEFWPLSQYVSKIFFHSVRFSLPKILLEPECIKIWLSFLCFCINMIRKDDPKSLYENIDVNLKRKEPQWVACKYCSKSLYRVLDKHGFKQYIGQQNHIFAATYQEIGQDGQSLFTRSLMSMLHILETYINKAYCTDVVLNQAINFVSRASNLSIGFKIIKPHLNVFFGKVMFPLLRIKPKDLEMWYTDAAQFVRDKFSYSYLLTIGRDPSGASENFIEELTQSRTQYVIKDLFSLLNSYVTNEQSVSSLEEFVAEYKYFFEVVKFDMNQGKLLQFQAAVNKTAAYIALEESAESLFFQSVQSSGFELGALLESELLNGMKNQLGFVRFHTCRTITKLIKTNEKNKQVGIQSQIPENLVQSCTQSILQLLEDPDVPVKVQACVSLSALVKTANETVLKTCAQHLEKVIQLLLALNQKIVVEEIFETLQTLIGRFSNQMAPMSVVLLNNLGKSFEEYYIAARNNIGKEIDTSEPDTELAAVDCLSAMNELISSVGVQENGVMHTRQNFECVWPSLQIILFDLENSKLIQQATRNGYSLDAEKQLFDSGRINFTLSGEMESVYGGIDTIDYLQTALETVRISTFYGKFVPKVLWRILPYIYLHYTTWGEDYTVDFANTLENMIHYDPESLLDPNIQFAENMICKKSNLEILLDFVDAGLMKSDDFISEVDKVGILTMLQTLVELPQLRGRLDQLMPKFLELILNLLRTFENAIFRAHVVLFLSSCIIYNSEIVFSFFGKLENGQDTFLKILSVWFKSVKRLQTFGEQKVCYLGFASLLPMEFPVEIKKKLLSKIVWLTISLDQLQRRKTEYKAKEKEQNDQLAAGNFKNLKYEDDDNMFMNNQMLSPQDVPEDLNVISSMNTNALDETKQELQNLVQFVAAHEKTAFEQHISGTGHQNRFQDTEGYFNDFDDNSSGSVASNQEDPFIHFDEEDEFDDEEGPLDEVDEKLFLFMSLSKCTEPAKKSFNEAMQKLGLEYQEILRTSYESGKRAAEGTK
eukprot:snap_masked-scaffold_39-processed-gene-0.5-mRNA-1 protein AED:1.00 eAED:1.00 QI:0/-1/0/0/-1/1/1/0/1193